MACERPAQTPGSDDVELDDILRHSDVIPTVVIRKDSSTCPAGPAAEAGDGIHHDDRLSTPAPMATFEVLSDVDESDMDDVTSLDASSRDHVKSHVRDSDSSLQYANGSVEAPPAAAAAAEVSDFDEPAQPDHVTSPRALGARDEDDVVVAGGVGGDEVVCSHVDELVPRLVFEDVDETTAVSQSQQSSECQQPQHCNDDLQQGTHYSLTHRQLLDQHAYSCLCTCLCVVRQSMTAQCLVE